MISRTTIEHLQLLQQLAKAGHNSDTDALAMALLESADDLIDAAIGYVAMQEESAFIYGECRHGKTQAMRDVFPIAEPIGWLSGPINGVRFVLDHPQGASPPVYLAAPTPPGSAAFLRAYDDWAESPEGCEGSLFDDMLEARARIDVPPPADDSRTESLLRALDFERSHVDELQRQVKALQERAEKVENVSSWPR